MTGGAYERQFTVYSSAEQNWRNKTTRIYLRYNANGFPQGLDGEILNVMACHKDTTVGRIIKSEQQPDNGGFSRTEQKELYLWVTI